MWVDEAAFMDPELFFNVILPIMEIAVTALIMISTLVSIWNYLCDLMKITFAGSKETVFNVLQQTLVCDRCMEKGRATSCIHKRHELPPFKNAGKATIVQLIYGRRRLELYKREALGIVSEGGGGYIFQSWLDAFREKEYFDWRKTNTPKPKYVFVCVDPNASGSNHTGVVIFSIIYTEIVVSFFFYNSSIKRVRFLLGFVFCCDCSLLVFFTSQPTKFKSL